MTMIENIVAMKIKTTKIVIFKDLIMISVSEIAQVKCLIELGARQEAVSAQGHGVIELAAFRRHVHILEYLLQRSAEDSQYVWNRLATTTESNSSDETEATVQVMLKPGFRQHGPSTRLVETRARQHGPC